MSSPIKKGGHHTKIQGSPIQSPPKLKSMRGRRATSPENVLSSIEETTPVKIVNKVKAATKVDTPVKRGRHGAAKVTDVKSQSSEKVSLKSSSPAPVKQTRGRRGGAPKPVVSAKSPSPLKLSPVKSRGRRAQKSSTPAKSPSPIPRTRHGVTKVPVKTPPVKVTRGGRRAIQDYSPVGDNDTTPLNTTTVKVVRGRRGANAPTPEQTDFFSPEKVAPVKRGRNTKVSVSENV